MNQEPSPIKDKILAAIDTGKVKMRPRWHFILQTSLIIVGVALISLTLLFLISFIIFSLRNTGVWFAPSFGYRGIGVFLTSLPWLLIVLTVIFVVLLEILVKKYSFAYRQPLLYSALALVLIVTIGGVAIAQTPFHRGVMRQTFERHLPVAETFYRGGGGMTGLGLMHAGSIEEITANGFILSSRRGEDLNIITSPKTQFPAGYDLIEGDLIVVMGERSDDTVQAFGVREIEAMPGEFIPRHQFPQRFRPPLPR